MIGRPPTADTAENVAGATVPEPRPLTALSGLGVAFAPPVDLGRRVLAQQFPHADGPCHAWHGLLAASGRPVR